MKHVNRFHIDSRYYLPRINQGLTVVQLAAVHGVLLVIIAVLAVIYE